MQEILLELIFLSLLSFILQLYLSFFLQQVDLTESSGIGLLGEMSVAEVL